MSDLTCDWVEVECNGQVWLVAPSYIAPVGIGEAIAIAEANGCTLPTPDLVDAIWRAADLRVAPPTIDNHDGTPRTMASPEVYARQAARIEALIAGRPFRLLAGTHKDVAVRDGKVGLYGWHRLDGRVIQGFFSGHARAWKDYSQGLRLVRPA